MTHSDIVLVLGYLYPSGPDGVWNYAGDGSTLESVVDPDSGEVLALGLTWHRTDVPPTLDVLEAALPAAKQALALNAIRTERDGLLDACDWTQLPDSPLDETAKTAWQNYRQKLRDYPDQAGFDPLSPPAWPAPPA